MAAMHRSDKGHSPNKGMRLCRGTTLLLAALALPLAGCNGLSQTVSHGYQLDPDALALVPEGSSREQVLLTLGTPSTTNTLSNQETFYYISQKKKKMAAFAQGRMVDQRVLAVYMGSGGTVERIANYGLKDGRVFDFKRRVTPTGGRDISFLAQLLNAAGTGTNTGKASERAKKMIPGG